MQEKCLLWGAIYGEGPKLVSQNLPRICGPSLLQDCLSPLAA